MTLTCEEARGFARSCGEYANGVGDAFCRGAFNKTAEVINILCDEIDASKEKEEGKEKNPPQTPYKEKGKEEKKAAATAARARARVKENFFPPTREEVVEYARKKEISADFVDYWLDCMESNYSPPWFDCRTNTFITAWRRNLLCYWHNSGKDKSWTLFVNRRNAEMAATRKPRKYSREEWRLCEERCRHFDVRVCRCRCGCGVPPEHREHPMTPEECERFNRKEATA